MMKKLLNPISITCGSAGLGLACMLARFWLFHDGQDPKGLLIASHPGNILAWIFTGLMAALLLLCLYYKPSKLQFRSNAISGTGSAVCTACMALLAWQFFSGEAATVLILITGILSVIATICCGILTALRFLHKRPLLVLQLPMLLVLIFLFLNNFQLWGAEPEHQRYFFSLISHACLMLACYYRIAAARKLRSPTAYLVCSCGGIFCGLAAVPDLHFGWLYALWAVGFLFENLSALPQRRVHHDAA